MSEADVLDAIAALPTDADIAAAIEAAFIAYDPPAGTNYCTNPASAGTKWGTDGDGATYTLESSPPVPLPTGFTSCTKMVHSSGSWQEIQFVGRMAVSPGDAFTLSVYIHCSAIAGEDTLSPSVSVYNDDAYVRAVPVPVSAVNASFVRVSTTVVVAGSGENKLTFKMYVTGGTGTYYATGCLIEKTDALHPYFDGDSAMCRWAGRVNASTSVRTSIVGGIAENALRMKTPPLPYNGDWIRHGAVDDGPVADVMGEVSVLPDGDGWQMWGSGASGLNYATADEIRGPYTLGTFQPLVSPGNTSNSYARICVRQIGDTYHCIASCNPDNVHGDLGYGQQLDHFTSPDGKAPWTLSAAAILTVSDVEADWDGYWITNSDFWLDDDGTYYILYEGGVLGGIDYLGIASGPDLDHLTKYASNPVIGTPTMQAASPCVRKKDGIDYCWFLGGYPAMLPCDILRAHALTPFAWIVDVVDPGTGDIILFGRTVDDGGALLPYGQEADPEVVEHNGRLYMFYGSIPDGRGGYAVAEERVASCSVATLDTVVFDSTSLAAIKLKTDTLGAADITVTSPVAESGTITLYAGDDYATDESRQITVTVADATHALVLDTGVVTLKCTQATFTATSVVSTTPGYTVTFELTHAETAALTFKRQKYEIEATLADSHIVTLAAGQLVVVADIPATPAP
jgi:hypothetical protein